MIEEGIRGGICHAVHRYAKASNRYMKDYDLPFLPAMAEKLPINEMERMKIDINSKVSLPFLPERMKIDKTQKLVWNLHDKKNTLCILAY